jgi:hypothetical protein
MMAIFMVIVVVSFVTFGFTRGKGKWHPQVGATTNSYKTNNYNYR